MKNRIIQNIFRGIFIFPIVLFIVFPIIFLLNSSDLGETYKDTFKGFWGDW